jgi:hypothetical protein
MAQHQSYIPLDSILQDYMNEAEVSQNKYFKCFHLAFRGMDEMGMRAFYSIKAVKLPRNDNYTVTLPADYRQWSKVGVLNDKGAIIPLYYNDKFTTYADLSEDRLTKTEDNSLLGDWDNSTWFNYWNGYSFSNVYGCPSGQPFAGNFKVDNANGVILLNENFQYDYIVLEYVASPVEGEDYYIPVQFREALIAWLWWRDKKAANINRGQVGISRDLKSEFYNQMRLAIAAWKPIRIYDMYQASQEQTRAAVKS